MTGTLLMIPVAALMAMEQAVNATLALDPNTLRRLARLDGKIIAVEMVGTGLTLFVAPQANGLRLMGNYDGTVDTTLRGAPLSLLRMSSGKAGEGLFSGDVTIDGDVETGQQLQRTLHGLDIDWEEHLSRLTGDVIGHQVGNMLRTLSMLSKNAISNFGLNLSEYMQEERRMTPPQTEIETFMTEVDNLRMATDRLGARIQHLRTKLHDSNE